MEVKSDDFWHCNMKKEYGGKKIDQRVKNIKMDVVELERGRSRHGNHIASRAQALF